MKSRGILVVISGFAGAGKGTIVKGLMEQHDNYALSVSVTTRAPRAGEENGVHYFFVSDKEFASMREKDQLLEHNFYSNNYYGTPKFYVEDKLKEGKDVILEIEVNGASKIKEKYPDALTIFVSAPDAKTQEERLRGRGTETDEDIRERLATAAKEAEAMDQYDYLIINEVSETCISQVHGIVEAERLRSARNMDIIEAIRQDFKKFSI